MRSAKKLLLPEGLFVVKFQVDQPWIAGRLQGLLTMVFQQKPLQFQSSAQYGTPGRFFLVGSQQKLNQALNDKTTSEFVRNSKGFEISAATLTTDDWPYFYQHEPGIPASVIIILSMLIVLCRIFMGKAGVSLGSLQWHFFFLGAAFMLLEAQIISRMALLFGTTWVVNSIVISSLMVLIVAANLIVHWRPGVAVTFAYIGIFASILVAYIVPPEPYFLGFF